jgi:hypothetical protein
MRTKSLRVENDSSEARSGGAGRNRTDDPLLAKQVLSQLSYSPILDGKSLSLMPREVRQRIRTQMVGLDRVELSTPRLSSACSNQLSYRPS